MTIANNYILTKQATDGSTKVFPFNYYALNENYIKVVKETGTTQTVVSSSDYVVDFNENNGIVTFNTAPESGSYIIIYRETPKEQETPFSTSSGFPAKVMENRLDKLTAMVQEDSEALGRSVKFPKGSTVSVEMPTPDPGKAIIWNQSGTALENSEDTVNNIVTTAKKWAEGSDSDVSPLGGTHSSKGWAEQSATSATNAQNAVNALVNDSGYQAVRADLIGNNTIGTCATNITDINTVAANVSDIGTVATDISSVNTVADDIAAVVAVNSNKTNIDTVASNISDVNTCATNISQIQSASTYAANAETWAEGNDTAVAALGGTHSAKKWAELSQADVAAEATTRELADTNLQGQIDAIVASSDVRDIVGTYTDLQNYDTTKLGNNDIVKVLVDSTHNDATSYYRWVITGGVGAWTYIGSEGPYLTPGTAASTYVPLTRTINSKALSSDITLTPSDIGAATSAQGAKADTAIQSVAQGSTNGTISVDGTDVAVKGLDSAAYTPSTDYATAAQGAKADTALQPADLADAIKSSQITIATTDWSTNTCTKSVTGVTSTSDVFVSPDPTLANIKAYAAANVFCSAIGSGTVTFTCETTPTTSLTVNIGVN